jgi:hypothetical protein
MSPETIMHYAMLIRLVSVVAIGAFGLGVAILVSFLRRHLARIDAGGGDAVAEAAPSGVRPPLRPG